VIQPSSTSELQDHLQQGSDRKRTIILGGNFSKNHYGGPMPEADVSLSMAKLNQVLEYQPADLTISVEAGMRWADLTELLAKNRQMVPLDPPFSEESTVGGVVACNLSGPRRRRFGTARDLVIGMQFATLDGKLVQCGGMVVKNVAGLDIAKLMIGSMGTLAAITSVNFKLNPIPEGTRTWIFQFRGVEEALATRDAILQSFLQPIAIDLLSQNAAELLGLPASAATLVAQAAGSDAVLSRFEDKWLQGESVPTGGEEALWQAIRSLPEIYLHKFPVGATVRISSAIGDMKNALAHVKAPFLARAGSGVAYAFFSDFQEAVSWCHQVADLGVRAFIEASAAPEKTSAGLWPDVGSDFATMVNVKRMFDPGSLLNRGRLYGRI
jgi:glycolate oxidase FAD binding subunit